MPRTYTLNRCRPVPEGAWDNTKTYLELSVVYDAVSGDSYTSKIPVPIGILLTNTTYWIKTSDFNSQLREKGNFYDNVAAMKADNSLTVGMTAMTKGYYTPNDGGNAFYEIVEGVYLDNGFYQQIGTSSLYAKLIVPALVNVKQLGAKGDSNGTTGNGTDNYLILTAVTDYCNTNKKTMYIPSGKYRITQKVIFDCPVIGDGGQASIIFNDSTGDAVEIGDVGYYASFMHFGIQGLPTSGKGLKIGQNRSYMSFHGIHCFENGTDGLFMQSNWGNKFYDCKFMNNGGLGVHTTALEADGSGNNALAFYGCEARWNGGTNTGTTYADNKGGVKIDGCQGFLWDGGVVESNNAWGFIIKSTYYANRAIKIVGVYTEYNPNGATVGGNFYITSPFSNIEITNGQFSYGAADAGKTGYCYYIDRPNPASENGSVKTNNNTMNAIGAGTKVLSLGRAMKKVLPSTSEWWGDAGGSGVAVTKTVCTVSDDGAYKISGFITVGRDSEAGGVFPFIAARYGSTRTVTVGSAISGSATIAPTMAWSGDDLQCTFGTYHYGFITVIPQMISQPTTFTFNLAIFEPNSEGQEIPF